MIILDTVKEKCKRVWARVQGEGKFKIDYVLTDTANVKKLKEKKVDEEKQYELHKLEKNTAANEIKKRDLDRCSVLILILKHQQKIKGHIK